MKRLTEISFVLATLNDIPAKELKAGRDTFSNCSVVMYQNKQLDSK